MIRSRDETFAEHIKSIKKKAFSFKRRTSQKIKIITTKRLLRGLIFIERCILLLKCFLQRSRDIYFCFILFSIIYCIESCSLDFPPEDQVSDPDAIDSITSSKKALAAAYASYNDYSYALEVVLLSDDMQPTYLLAQNANLQSTYLWEEKALLSLAETIWQNNYKTIARVNVLLARLDNVATQTSEEQTELYLVQSHAKQLKALCYFQLLKFFSPAFSQGNEKFGILLKDSFDLTTQKQRVSLSASVKAIENLLEQSNAQDALTIGSSQDRKKLYLNNDAVNYLRASLALWNGDYQKTLRFALPLYEKYKGLLTNNNPSDIFWSDKEIPSLSLFALDISTNKRIYNELNEGVDKDDDEGDDLKVSSKIQYDATDTRYTAYSIPFTMGKQQVFLLGKYNRNDKEKSNKVFIYYYTKFRVAGLFFLCAEAYLKSGKKRETVNILNEFLTARNSPTIPYTDDSDTLLTRLLFEKQKEFVGEPERFFDLKRNRKAIKRFIGTSSYTIEADDYRWTLPIPLSEKKNNRKITQNKGWEHIDVAR